jgi:hypothetical protein
MATREQVKLYLAYWFQLGKRVLLKNGEEAWQPQPVFFGNRYSYEFETCWQQMLEPDNGDCYLEGTEQTIQQLLTPVWDIVECAKCEMPVPMSHRGYLSSSCPCFDLPSWPNLELPLPRQPANNRQSLLNICRRLQKLGDCPAARKPWPPIPGGGGEFRK